LDSNLTIATPHQPNNKTPPMPDRIDGVIF
jgi:hypothetical protein